MNIDQCRQELKERVPGILIMVPEHSLLSGPAHEVREMVLAYESDGWKFESGGDDINALASYAYALGWLDAGCCIGLIKTEDSVRRWFLPGSSSMDSEDERLMEKTTRYHELLGRACEAVEPAPDKGSLLLNGSERILMVGRTFLLFGKIAVKEQGAGVALLCFSYGFGWLDAGIRAGLLAARKYRDIFTI